MAAFLRDDELNDEQRAVVDCHGGPMLVIAGAGSGKTRVIVHRLAALVRSGVPPDAILLLTFTKKAAEQMLERAASLLGTQRARFFGGTFHHFAHRILKLHAAEAGLPPSFTILDAEDADDLIGECRIELVERRLTTFELPKVSQIRKILSLAENLRRPIPDVIAEHFPLFTDLADPVARLRDLYAARKRDAGVVDFDDLLAHLLRLLETDAAVRERVQGMFRHVMVDEYQDTNVLQARIALAVAERHRNLMVVGDDMQSIYAFRGAHHRNILEFEGLVPGTRRFTLSTNYRSTPPVLGFANAIIRGARHGFKRDLAAARGGGEPPEVVQVPDDREEAAYVAEEIARDLDAGIPPAEVAALYRAHSHSLRLQTELMRRGIPFQVRSGKKFLELAHVKDLFAFYRVVVNPRDAVALGRLFRLVPGAGAKTVAKLVEAAAAGRLAADARGIRLPEKARGPLGGLLGALDATTPAASPDEAAQRFMAGFYAERLPFTYDDPEERARDVEALAALAAEFGSIERLVGELSLTDEAFGRPPAKGEAEPSVVLSSVHQAKGLEWRCVYLMRLQDGAFPTAQALADPDRLEEERRLFYVAVTRAKEKLAILYPLVTSGYKTFFSRASRFLDEIPESAYAYRRGKRPF